MDSQRVHHAWIFHGPAGVGKRTTAVAFAALLLDPTLTRDLSGRLAPDPDSPTQRQIRAHTHPDLAIISKDLAAVSRDTEVRSRKQTNIPKEVLREFLIEPSSKSRATLGAPSLAARVFIVDDADLLDVGGQNTILKVLEEPPPGCIIILITSREDRLVATIRSRCQRIGFSRLAEADMRRWWQGRPESAGASVSADWLLGFADGSPGVAISAAESNLEHWYRTIAPLVDSALAGRPPADMGSTLARLIGDRIDEWGKANRDVPKDAANRMWARRMIAMIGGIADKKLRTSESSDDRRRITSAIDALVEAETQIHTSVQIHFVMECLAAGLAGRD